MTPEQASAVRDEAAAVERHLNWYCDQYTADAIGAASAQLGLTIEEVEEEWFR